MWAFVVYVNALQRKYYNPPVDPLKNVVVEPRVFRTGFISNKEAKDLYY